MLCEVPARYEFATLSPDDWGETFERGEVLGSPTHTQLWSLDDSTIRLAPGPSQHALDPVLSPTDGPNGIAQHCRPGCVAERRDPAPLEIYLRLSLPQGGEGSDSRIYSPLSRLGDGGARA